MKETKVESGKSLDAEFIFIFWSMHMFKGLSKGFENYRRLFWRCSKLKETKVETGASLDAQLIFAFANIPMLKGSDLKIIEDCSEHVSNFENCTRLFCICSKLKETKAESGKSLDATFIFMCESIQILNSSDLKIVKDCCEDVPKFWKL